MTWPERAAAAHAVLLHRFGRRGGLFRLSDPPLPGDRWRLGYWWQAQALDALVDAQQRAPSAAGTHRIRAFVAALYAVRGGRLVNDYYDDVAWMALALLRAGHPRTARRLWRHLQSGWSDVHGGGICWSRGQPDYKNVPANGPCAILAARLYRHDGDPADLDWARRIVAWIDDTLVDHRTGLVADGIGRRGDDHIDADWLFTYTHGVVIGAHDELFALTGDAHHAERAAATVRAVETHLAPDGILPDEGDGDGAMFRGILARYLAPRELPLLRRSAEQTWAHRDTEGRFGPTLAAHLSGLSLCEQLARFSQNSQPPGAHRP
ncbi:glycoside hydrolase family 76 protein [Cryptosporangium phraense]|uniref:Glycosyl hydrolase n=1 Tax=Cryptosporangium phraense TaxID=2593070 RepID=A0A545AXM0_9ACTN|nr:glycoside hydrolase family 76 protein [Cryptosporangium phraense]TQS46070.1 glycosyl hydrolase [Cryptosporangium phraense]